MEKLEPSWLQTTAASWLSHSPSHTGPRSHTGLTAQTFPSKEDFPPFSATLSWQAVKDFEGNKIENSPLPYDDLHMQSDKKETFHPSNTF